MKLSIVIPCYNEKDTIENIVSVVKKVNLGDVEKEIIIVDDCSKDGTREILETLKDNDVKVILHEKNKGKGGALKTGYQEVSGDIVIVQDADHHQSLLPGATVYQVPYWPQISKRKQ